MAHPIRLDLQPRTWERLQSIKERTEARSYAEVIREALRHYEAALNNTRAVSGQISLATQEQPIP
jgi:hypothetical protein